MFAPGSITRNWSFLQSWLPWTSMMIVFPGRSAGGCLNQDAMADVLAKLHPGVTVHGFRSTFRDWAAERA